MDPQVRAITDRFIYEQATLKHIIGLVPEDGFGRPVHGGEWQVRQLLAHLAQSLLEYAGIVAKWLTGEPPLPGGWNPDTINAETARARVNVGESELLALFGQGLTALVAALGAVPDDKIHERLGPGNGLEVLRVFANHCQGHAIALVDALPEVRLDPLVLNWLLHLEFPDEASQTWQRALLDDARRLVVSQQEQEE
jgi:hypothetical protein